MDHRHPEPVDRYYEWLLSDAPAAWQERAWRRADRRRAIRRDLGDVEAWCERTLATPAPPNLRELAENLRGHVERHRARDAADDAVPDAERVRKARALLEAARRNAGDDEYRYPERYLGPGAAVEPIPDEPLTATWLRPGDLVRMRSGGPVHAVTGVERARDPVVVVTSEGGRACVRANGRVFRVHDPRFEPDPPEAPRLERRSDNGHGIGLDP